MPWCHRAYVSVAVVRRLPNLLLIAKRVFPAKHRFELIVLSLLIQVAVTRLGLGMWQTITILQCPPRQTLLPDPTVKT